MRWQLPELAQQSLRQGRSVWSQNAQGNQGGNGEPGSRCAEQVGIAVVSRTWWEGDVCSRDHRLWIGRVEWMSSGTRHKEQGNDC